MQLVGPGVYGRPKTRTVPSPSFARLSRLA